MRYAPHHTFVVLTKRPERMAAWFAQLWERPGEGYVRFGHERRPNGVEGHIVAESRRWPLPNVWLGVTAENQRAAEERIPVLLEIPAAVRWVSVEPMLGPVDLARFLTIHECADCGWTCHHHQRPLDRKNNRVCPSCGSPYCAETEPRGGYELRWAPDGMERARPIRGLDWVVVGGETGPGARPMHLEWVEALIAQCRQGGVPVFVKQLGSAWAGGKGCRGRSGEPATWSEALAVREFPAGGGEGRE